MSVFSIQVVVGPEGILPVCGIDMKGVRNLTLLQEAIPACRIVGLNPVAIPIVVVRVLMHGPVESGCDPSN